LYYRKSADAVLKTILRGGDVMEKKKIYILLTRLPNTAAPIIEAMTGSYYTHTSIGLEEDMNTFYSFGFKGFVAEKITQRVRPDKTPFPCQLYELDKAEKAGDSSAPLAAANGAEPQCADLRDALAAVTLFTTLFFQLGTAQEQQFISNVWQNCGVHFLQGEKGAELRLDQKAYEGCAKKREELWSQNAPHLWEHLMVNQLFQDRLPFADGADSVWDNTLYFCAVYAILRFLAAGVAGEGWQATEDALVRGFRKYTHSTQLKQRTVEQLKRRGMATPKGLAALLTL
jgi:hypothetical protein